MSERDKKLLIYLGAIVIIAAAYFLVTKPFLDKYDKLKADNQQLENVLREKRLAFENQDTYLQGIDQSKEEIDKMLSKFPAASTDEKTIVFLSKAEKEDNIWISQIKFAEKTEDLIDNEESASEEEAAATQEVVESVEAEVNNDVSDESDEVDQQADEKVVDLRGYVGVDTEVGISFFSTYNGLKKFIEHLRDYDERLVIKNMESKYNKEKVLVETTMTISQYAVAGPGRQEPEVKVDNIDLGRSDLFANGPGGMDSLIGDLSSLMGQALNGSTDDSATAGEGTSYFIAVSGIVDGAPGKTIGRANDPEGLSYITSGSNSDENVYFELTGSNGVYHATYELAGKKYEDKEFSKSANGSVVLSIMSKDRRNADDDVEISLHVTNKADIPIKVIVSSDDRSKPRVDVVETNGDVNVSQ